MVDFEAIEEAILCQVAGKVIDALPEDERRKILEGALTKTLNDVLRPWAIKEAIEADVHKYLVEYVKQPEVQERIRVATENAINELMTGVINSIIYASQDAIKSRYDKFIEEEKKKK
jgi:hypothetical protein